MAEPSDTVKEATLNLEPIGTILLTAEGYQALQRELENLTLVKRPEIAERIRDSQEHGEFSEDNNELDEVKFEQAMVENRIAELKSIFGTAQQLDPADIPTDRVGVGSVVKLLDEAHDEEFEVRIVSSVEADPSRDLISNESPMGVALVGGQVGQVADVEAPDGVRKYKILGIRK